MSAPWSLVLSGKDCSRISYSSEIVYAVQTRHSPQIRGHRRPKSHVDLCAVSVEPLKMRFDDNFSRPKRIYKTSETIIQNYVAGKDAE